MGEHGGERDALPDIAMAHLRLTQSLRGLSLNSPAWKATTDALVACAEAIADRLTPPAGGDSR